MPHMKYRRLWLSLFVVLFAMIARAASDTVSGQVVPQDSNVAPVIASPDIRPSQRAVVSTTNGPVAGFASQGVINFLGVPFAKAPIGDLRFSPPQDPDKWSNLFPAASYGAVCAQMNDRMEPSSQLY